MLDATRFSLFLTAAVLLAVAPGPGMLYVLARSFAGGRREGALSALGTFFGGMVHVFAAALGVSVVLAKSALAFAAVKYVGAAYLCFLGARMILDARKENTPERDGQNRTTIDYAAVAVAAASSIQKIQVRRNPLWQGMVTEVLNPKTALFFLSFIPQFVTRESGHIFLQFVLLGTLSVVLNTSADLIVIALAEPLSHRIRSSKQFRRKQKTVTGAIMIGLGAYLATSETK